MSSPYPNSASPAQSTSIPLASGMAVPAPQSLARSPSYSSVNSTTRPIAPSPATSLKSLLPLGTNPNTTIEDPISGARRVLGVLQGERSTVTGLRDEGGGLLGEIERALEDCFAGGERVFEEGVDSAETVASIKHTLTLIATLLSLLRSTPLGGIPISPSPPTASLIQNPLIGTTTKTDPTIQERIEEKQRLVQRLFKDRQRVRESAEVVSGILSKIGGGGGAGSGKMDVGE